jgi:hypothetical protein
MNNWIYNNVTGTATVPQASGALFYSTAGAGTKMNVTMGQDVDVKYVLRADSSYVDFADFGVVIYVNASVGSWNEPKLSVNGVQLSPAVLSDAEKRKYSEYEYAYKMADAPATGALLADRDVELVFQMSALSDVDPSATLDVLFASSSATKQVSGSNIVYATTGDSATNIQPVFSEMMLFSMVSGWA